MQNANCYYVTMWQPQLQQQTVIQVPMRSRNGSNGESQGQAYSKTLKQKQ